MCSLGRRVVHAPRLQESRVQYQRILLFDDNNQVDLKRRRKTTAFLAVLVLGTLYSQDRIVCRLTPDLSIRL